MHGEMHYGHIQTLHAGCRMKNIRKGSLRGKIARLRIEVLVRHTVHDVQLPIPELRHRAWHRSPFSLQAIGRMYYMLKEGSTIKHFAGNLAINSQKGWNGITEWKKCFRGPAGYCRLFFRKWYGLDLYLVFNRPIQGRRRRWSGPGEQPCVPRASRPAWGWLSWRRSPGPWSCRTGGSRGSARS